MKDHNQHPILLMVDKDLGDKYQVPKALLDLNLKTGGGISDGEELQESLQERPSRLPCLTPLIIIMSLEKMAEWREMRTIGM